MKRLSWLLVVFALTATPSWCAKRISVGELRDMLASMHRDGKSDADVSTALKQIQLSEQLTRSTMNGLVGDVPGPLSTEQIYVLEARSADLAPPESDIPTTPALDAAAQQALLAKAASYVQGTYGQLPTLKATKTTLRFQDNMEALSSSSGLVGGAKEVLTNPSFSNPATYVRYIGSSDAPVALQHGTEQAEIDKKTKWGANGMIALQTATPSLDTVFPAAQAGGALHWLRWELVNGRPAAVFAFEVPKNKSKLDVAVCCFPDVSQAGRATFYTATTSAALGGSGGGGGAKGNFQTSTDWHQFKSVTPYHGELFIDPDSGIVVRMIVESELKPSDVVHRVDTRVDYAPVLVGGKTFVLPTKSFVNTEVVPNGESGAGGYSTRCTLFTSEFKDYQPGSGK